MTICTECAHHLHVIKNPAAPDVWYNHFCAAQPLAPAIDTVTGESGYTKRNDLGTVYVSKDAFGYCRDLNDGNCPRFQYRDSARPVDQDWLKVKVMGILE